MSDATESVSTNERAERLMGRRLKPEDEGNVVLFDRGPELGYWCPVCKQPWDEEVVFSEYNGFIWCGRCNKDYPSALCVPLEGEAPTADYVNHGPDDAITVFLDTVEDAIRRAVEASSPLPADFGGEREE